MPLGIGYELETGGHVFSVNVPNAAGIIEQHFIPLNNVPWKKGEIKSGFHILRNFAFKSSHQKTKVKFEKRGGRKNCCFFFEKKFLKKYLKYWFSVKK